MPIGYIWQTFLETPLINIMVALSALTWGSYGLAILIFTVIIRVLLFPLTMRMLKSMRGLQEIGPQMQELQKKYSDPKRRNEEMMKLYREAGINPLGCIGPQLIQLPIFIALFQVIRTTLGNTPEAVVGLSGRLYDWDIVQSAAPLSRSFLWMDLGANGDIILAVLCFCAMWLQQRLSMNKATMTTDQQRQMNSMMLWMLPAMFAWFVIITPAGVGLYWTASTIIGVILHWSFVGPGDFTWGSLIPNRVRRQVGMPEYIPGEFRHRYFTPRKPAADTETDSQPVEASEGGTDESRANDASSRDERKNGRRGDRSGAESTRPKSRSGRRRRRHRR
jgi:YidC/Oxa1 family membrane protein insertase